MRPDRLKPPATAPPPGAVVAAASALTVGSAALLSTRRRSRHNVERASAPRASGSSASARRLASCCASGAALQGVWRTVLQRCSAAPTPRVSAGASAAERGIADVAHAVRCVATQALQRGRRGGGFCTRWSSAARSHAARRPPLPLRAFNCVDSVTALRCAWARVSDRDAAEGGQRRVRGGGISKGVRLVALLLSRSQLRCACRAEPVLAMSASAASLGCKAWRTRRRRRCRRTPHRT